MAELLPIALDYGAAGYEVLPLRGKAPAIKKAHPDGDPLQGKCKGECGRDGHGVLDATTDPASITAWFTRYPWANIGGRVPAALMVLDVDPRHGGHDSLAELVAQHGPLPDTRISYSGRGDGGRHFWLVHPGGKPSSKRLGPGLDVKTNAGYVVLPPSIHPDSGQPYQWDPAHEDVAPAPSWLRQLLQPEQAVPPLRPRFATGLGGDTLADALSWSQILPAGWYCLDADPDADGARWRHPTATAALSATIRHGCLFVYSTNTPFNTTEAGTPAGYTKLRAYATLYHRGDCSAAHRDLSNRRAA